MIFDQCLIIISFCSFALKISVEHFLKNREVFQRLICCDSFPQQKVLQQTPVAFCVEFIEFFPHRMDGIRQVRRGLQYRVKKMQP